VQLLYYFCNTHKQTIKKTMFLIDALFVSIGLTWLAIYFGRRFGLVDIPDQRKQHTGEVPLVGGMAVFASLLICSLMLGIPPYTYQMLIIATGVFLVGVYDDYKHINPWIRLAIQYGAGVLLATWGGIVIINVGNLMAMGEIPLLALAVPLTALSVAGLSNAYNMIDGVDGLAASLIALPLAVLYGLAAQVHHVEAPFLLLMLIPLAIFLVFNLGPTTTIIPKIFLGDGGSVTLGFLVTSSLVYFSQGENAVIAPVTALWLVTVPLMDMLATMARRLKSGKKLMEADRSHLHYTLMGMGLSSPLTLAVLVSYGLGCALLGLYLERIPAYLSLLAYFILFFCHCIFVIVGSKGETHSPSDANS
jgi:UDP-GlcNAc:undecaprenyl-phosphate/decaprenyl-phosphate GlcNAc-1-phosphate transferase